MPCLTKTKKTLYFEQVTYHALKLHQWKGKHPPSLPSKKIILFENNGNVSNVLFDENKENTIF